jgi:U3 small nucleolar RNA-associated protein 3
LWLNLETQNWQNDEVGVQSMEMLKVRAALEEKLKQKGAFSSFSSKPDKAQKHRRPVNGYFYCFYPP